MALTSLTDGQRRVLQVVSVILIVVGLGLFVTAAVTMFAGPSPGSETFAEDAASHGARIAGLGIGGVLLFGIGSMLARLAFLKPVSELAATETSGALEHAAGAVGRGLGTTNKQVVKIKCRACGYLDSEDAKFCSDCGQPI